MCINIYLYIKIYYIILCYIIIIIDVVDGNHSFPKVICSWLAWVTE